MSNAKQLCSGHVAALKHADEHTKKIFDELDKSFAEEIANGVKYICPFCGCSELSGNYWDLDDVDEEVKALECTKCFAGAPLKAWEKLAEDMDNGLMIGGIKQ